MLSITYIAVSSGASGCWVGDSTLPSGGATRRAVEIPACRMYSILRVLGDLQAAPTTRYPPLIQFSSQSYWCHGRATLSPLFSECFESDQAEHVRMLNMQSRNHYE